MPSEANHLRADLTFIHPKVTRAQNLQVRVVLTNTGTMTIRINTLLFAFATLMLRVRRDDGTPVPSGPPPMPPVDDGERGRLVLKPGETHAFLFAGDDYFATPVPAGRYQVQFRCKNAHGNPGEWQGEIVTEWQNFEVDPAGRD